MNDNDVRRVVYTTILGFLAVVVAWVSFIYLRACGFTFSCNRAAPLVVRTSVPTLIPAHPVSSQKELSPAEFTKCNVAAADLVGAWVTAGSPASDSFPFADLNGQSCQGSYSADIQPLFVENSIWVSREIGCVSCHNADLSLRSGGLDLTSIDAMRKGAGRADANATGSDIFGGGNWAGSSLYDVLVNQGLVATGHSKDVPAKAVILYAGEKAAPSATSTP